MSAGLVAIVVSLLCCVLANLDRSSPCFLTTQFAGFYADCGYWDNSVLMGPCHGHFFRPQAVGRGNVTLLELLFSVGESASCNGRTAAIFRDEAIRTHQFRHSRTLFWFYAYLSGP